MKCKSLVWYADCASLMGCRKGTIMEINIKLNQEEIEPIRSKILRKAAGNRPKADYSTVEERNAFLQGYAVGVRRALEILKNEII